MKLLNKGYINENYLNENYLNENYLNENYLNENYLNESTWDIEDHIEDDNKESILTDIKKFIEDAYGINIKYCDLTFNKRKNKYIANSRTNLTLNSKFDTLTNGLFEWNTVKGWFDCSESPIKTLEGAPKFVEGAFDCHGCRELTTLEGAPETYCVVLDCSNCFKLESLEGVPKIKELQINCSNCPKITSLKGLPKKEIKGLHCPGCVNWYWKSWR